jgi:hypothetical protein
VDWFNASRQRGRRNAVKTEYIDTDEIVGLKCPKTSHRILWNDECIEDVLPGTVASAVITSLAPEECAVESLPLAAAWKSHYQSVSTAGISLGETVSAFPAPGNALKVVSGGMTCGPLTDMTYYIVPDDLPDGCFIRAVGGQRTRN